MNTLYQVILRRLAVLFGLAVVAVVPFVAPATPASSARVNALVDIPTFLQMPLEQALIWLSSAAVLGFVVHYALVYFGVGEEQATQISAVAVAVVGAALTAGLKYVPPATLNATVYQVLLNLIAYFTSLAGVGVARAQVRVAGLD